MEIDEKIIWFGGFDESNQYPEGLMGRTDFSDAEELLSKKEILGGLLREGDYLDGLREEEEVENE